MCCHEIPNRSKGQTMKNTELQILAKAREADKRSMRYFTQEQNETDPEMKQIYHARWNEYDGMVSAYLDCYEIITGIKIKNIGTDIESEYAKVYNS